MYVRTYIKWSTRAAKPAHTALALLASLLSVACAGPMDGVEAPQEAPALEQSEQALLGQDPLLGGTDSTIEVDLGIIDVGLDVGLLPDPPPVECPCYSTVQLDETWQAFQAAGWESTTVLCEDYTYFGDGYHYDWGKLYMSGTTTANGVISSSKAMFYSVDYVDGHAGTYCLRSTEDSRRDENTRSYLSYSEEFDQRDPITDEEHAACVRTALDFARSVGVTCQVTDYP